MALLNELRGLGDCKVVAQRGDLPTLAEMEGELCYIYWDIILTTGRGINAIKDVFIFVEDDCELRIEIIDDGGRLDNEADYKKLGDILVERGDLSPEDMKQVLSEQKRFGELLVEKGAGANRQDPVGACGAAACQGDPPGAGRARRRSQASGSRRINWIPWSTWWENW